MTINDRILYVNTWLGTYAKRPASTAIKNLVNKLQSSTTPNICAEFSEEGFEIDLLQGSNTAILRNRNWLSLWDGYLSYSHPLSRVKLAEH